MSDILICRPETRIHRLGGREVLSLQAELPEGESPAAAHLRELVITLLEHAEQQLLSTAPKELRVLSEKGELHRFFSYRYRVKLQTSTQNSLFRIVLAATLRRGAELLFTRELVTLWNTDLTLQYDVERFKRRPLRHFLHKIQTNSASGLEKA